MEQALAAFRQFLTAEKRASEHTVRAYLHDLDEFREHAVATLGRAPELDELDVIMCRSYLASLHGKNDAVTIGRKLSSLRAFFRLAVRRRLCKSSPVAALRAPKRAKRLPSAVCSTAVPGPTTTSGRTPAAARSSWRCSR